MSELQNRLEKLMLRLDCMGMRIEQAFLDALDALHKGDIPGGQRVDDNDSVIDREEVEIEQECIRLLALYQPTAVDLRTICTVIKVNNDLERIADLAASIGRRVRHLVDEQVDLTSDAVFTALVTHARETVARTVRMVALSEADLAKAVIALDEETDAAYRRFLQSVLDGHVRAPRKAEAVIAMMNVAKALERIGDLCTNIAEDIIFLRTGDIVRHSRLAAELEKAPPIPTTDKVESKTTSLPATGTENSV